jgi:hypothetical protein
MQFIECSHQGMAVRLSGKESILENCIFDKCNSAEPNTYRSGGIHVESGKNIIKSCIFKNTEQITTAVQQYNICINKAVEEKDLNSLLKIESNIFDRGICSYTFGNGIKDISIVNNTFNEKSKILIKSGSDSEISRYSIKGNTFFNNGIDLNRTYGILIEGNRFISNSSLESAIKCNIINTGLVVDNVFENYGNVNPISNFSSLQFGQNYYSGTRLNGELNHSQFNPISQFELQLKANTWTDFPSSVNYGAYMVIVNGIGNETAQGVYSITDNSQFYAGSINIIQRTPFYNTTQFYELEMPLNYKTIRIKSPRDVNVRIVLIGGY